MRERPRVETERIKIESAAWYAAKPGSVPRNVPLRATLEKRAYEQVHG